MQDIRFVEYIPTTDTGKQLGVAYIAFKTVSFGEVMLGFKIVEKKDGTGRFIAEPTWKYEHDGEEDWKPWIMIDSNIAKAQIHSMIREGVKNHNETKKTLKQSDDGLPF